LTFNALQAYQEIWEALLDEEFQEALRRASTISQVRVEELLAERGELVELCREVASIKRRSIDTLEELVERAYRSLELNHTLPGMLRRLERS
jgi:L-lactate utilization protein LutB